MDSLDPIEAPPRFPPELERPIFTLAAEHCPETLPALLLVARRACEWLEPLRYSTLRIKGKVSPKFLSLLRLKGPSFLAAHVSCTILDVESKEGLEILAQCVGAVEVVLQDGTQKIFSKLAQYSRLRKLSLDVPPSELFTYCLNTLNMVLPTLTHLEFNGFLVPSAQILARYCPSLSHLMIYFSGFPIEKLLDILNLPQIRLVILLLQPLRKSDPGPGIFKHDKLITINLNITPEQRYLRRDWVTEMPDRIDYWERAEQMLQSRVAQSNVNKA
ncbi:hypothetical protein DL96DRAFT_1630872 [Flagelloscypha sp. PMI_526]|nr:hypothetical protein DL96DRAFT_1630872 [Flagelloscypha sp. PMI_526]